MSTIKSSSEDLTLDADGTGKSIKFQCNNVEKASIDSSGNFTSTSIDATKLSGALPAIDGSSLTGVGKVLQVVNSQTATMATGTTTIPYGDTLPQNTEGNEYMTLAITPTSATNKLKIEFLAIVSNSADAYITAALFQDAGVNSIEATMTNVQGHQICTPVGTHYMTAGTTSATTFKVRIGSQTSGTTTLNGVNSGRLMGGALISSITITEIEV